MPTNEHRDNTITIAKAIGILCVVMAHAMNPEWLTWKVIYTFHMPLFFLLSGYCFKEKYLDDAKAFVVRKIKGIYVPIVIYSLVFLALHFITFKLVSLGVIGLYGLPIEQLEEFPVMMVYSVKGWWIVYTIAGMALPLTFAYSKDKISGLCQNKIKY